MSECQPRKTENYQIDWDEWAMPIVRASSKPGLFEGYGFTQAFLNPNLLLLAYLRAQGRSAEYVGKLSGSGPNLLTKQPAGVDYLYSDKLIRSMGIPQLAEEVWQSQDGEMKVWIKAFARGVNDCQKEYPERFDKRLAKAGSVTPEMIIGHACNIFLGFQIMIRLTTISEWVQGKSTTLPSWQDFANAGSNGCVIGENKSHDGHPMLVINPHTQWDVDLNTFTEVRLELTDGSGFCFQGATMLGMPVPMMGCNAHIGYGGTVNTQSGITFYEIQANNSSYALDGESQSLDVSSQELKVIEKDGSFTSQKHTVVYSKKHDAYAIASREDKLLLVNVGSRHCHHTLRQFADMMQAKDLSGFKEALECHQMPLFNLLFSGRDEDDQKPNIHYSWHTLAPARDKGSWADWWQVLDGHISDNIPQGRVAYEQLFKLENPTSGWIQNCNDSPYFATLPSPFNPKDYPEWLCPVYSNIRGQSYSRLMCEHDKFNFESFKKAKFSTRVELAIRTVPQLCDAITTQHSPNLQEAKKVLLDWDLHTDPESKGAYLFLQWVLNLGTVDPNATPLFSDTFDQGMAADPTQCYDSLNKPSLIDDMTHALAVLEKAVGILIDEGYSAGVAWGEALTISHGQYSFPAIGGSGDPLGIVAGVPLKPKYRPFIKGGSLPANRIENEGGETFVMVVQFTPSGAEGGTMVSYGQSSHINSKHYGDQLALLSSRELRSFAINK